MISVKIFKNRNGEYQGFNCLGHAGYDDEGKDIVCASVSMIVINTINSIETFTSDVFTCKSDEKTGEISFKFVDSPSKEATLLVDSLVLGLKGIVKEYGKAYLKLLIKEV